MSPCRPERRHDTVQRSALEGVLLKACRLDVIAFKPGNVSVCVPGHGMEAADFLRSAKAAVPALCRPGQSVGARIEAAIAATWQVNDCNTNLGIVLLLAPLAAASEHGGALAVALETVLAAMDVEDTRGCFRAIRRAMPAGLGSSAREDVNDEPTLALREVMALSATRDRIAAEYVTGYADILQVGVPLLCEYRARWRSLAWATTACYLWLLAAVPDSHIVRKYDRACAEAVSARARTVAKALKACENPRSLAPQLLAFDRELKTRGINPGTTADLTVASLAAMLLQQASRNEERIGEAP